MRRFGMLLIMSLLLTAGVSAQDDFFAQLESVATHPDHVQPLIRLGWGYPYDVAWTPDGNRLIVSTGAGIWLYDAHNLDTEAGFIETGTHKPYHIAISPDGALLATGGDDTRLWDIATGTLLDILPTGAGVGGLAFSPDGTLLAVTKSMNGSGRTNQRGIYLYDSRSGREQAHVLDQRAFSNVRFMPDGDHLLVRSVFDCCGRGLIVDWHSGEYQEIESQSYAFLLLPDGKTLLDYTIPDGLRVFDLDISMSEPIRSAAYEDETLFTLGLIQGGTQVVALTHRGEMIRWNSDTLEQTARFETGLSLVGAALSPDSTLLALLDKDGLLRLINPVDGSTVMERRHFVPRTSLIQFAGENRLAYVMNRQEIWLWNFDTLKNERVLVGHEGRITGLIFDPDNETLYSAGQDGTVRSWDVSTGVSRIMVDTSGVEISAMAMGFRDDIYVATCSRGAGTIGRYALDTGESIGFDSISPQDGHLIPVPVVETDDCGENLIFASLSLIYYDSSKRYQITDNLVGITPPVVPSSDFPPMVYNPRLIQASPDTWPLLVYGGVALVDDQTDLYLMDDPYAPYPVVSHTYPITALAQINDFSYVSAACGTAVYFSSGDMSCFGVDMVITSGLLYYAERRYPLIGHSAPVYQVVVDSDKVFASASDDGTIIIWGAPVDGAVFEMLRVP